MNDKARGEISEAKAIAALLEKGYSVSTPFGNNQRYDVIVDDGNKLSKVQVKTGRLRNGCVEFNTTNVNCFNGKRKSYVGQIDYFVVYCPDTDKLYKIDIEDASCGSSMSLRIETPRKVNTTIKWAKDYLL